MKICIPTSEGKLCGHFGHCDSFTFAEINPETKEIISIEERVPEEGISCQSASWISEQGVSKVLAEYWKGRWYYEYGFIHADSTKSRGVRANW